MGTVFTFYKAGEIQDVSGRGNGAGGGLGGKKVK